MEHGSKLKRKIYLKIAIDYIWALLILLFVIFCVPKIILFFMPFVIGYAVSVIANPIVKFLEKRMKIVRKHGSVLIIVLVVALICFSVYWICSVLIGQAIGITQDMPETLITIKHQATRFVDKFYNVYYKMPDFLQDYLLKVKSTFNNSADLVNFSSSISVASTAVKNLADIIVGIFFTILSAYFFTAEKDKLEMGYKKIVPYPLMEKIRMIYNYFATAVGGYFKAQFKIMIILIAILFVTLELLDVHYSFLISLGIGLLDFLPVFGTGAVLWPWAAYEFVIGSYTKGIVFVALYVVCQIVKQILQPKVVGDSIGLSPLVTLLLLFIGYKIGGLVGILIALPIGLVVINLYRAGTFDVLIDDIKFLHRDIVHFCERHKVSDLKGEDIDDKI